MRHAGENINRNEVVVETVPLSIVQRMVEEHHYARGGANTATFRHGLFYRGNLIATAWWIPPTKAAAMANWKGDWREVLTLSRLVCLPEAPRNTASALLSRSVRLIQQDARWAYLLTYADTWRGHSGAIYRACGWEYLGKTAPESVWVDPSGRMMGRKRGPKTMRKQDMLEAGFTHMGRFAKHRYGKKV